MAWDLFSQQPIMLIHPSVGRIPAAAVSPTRNGVCWWNANYIVSANMPGGVGGGSGFAENPIEGKLAWHEEDQSWRLTSAQDNERIYKFQLPDERMLAQWEEVKQYVPPILRLHKSAEHF